VQGEGGYGNPQAFPQGGHIEAGKVEHRSSIAGFSISCCSRGASRLIARNSDAADVVNGNSAILEPGKRRIAGHGTSPSAR